VGPPHYDDWDREAAIHSRMGEPSFNVATGLDRGSIYTGLTPTRCGEVARLFDREFGPTTWVAWRRFGLNRMAVNEAWAPGWKAHLDGAPAAILPADALVRAVAWPPGRHLLEMRYQPWEASAGLAASGHALAPAAGLVLAQCRRAAA
jgi:hypothetical protein